MSICESYIPISWHQTTHHIPCGSDLIRFRPNPIRVTVWGRVIVEREYIALYLYNKPERSGYFDVYLHDKADPELPRGLIEQARYIFNVNR